MTSYIYESAFSSGSESLSTGAAPSADDSTSHTPGVPTPQRSNRDGSSLAFSKTPEATQGLASFICHTAFLESRLQRGDKSAFFASKQARVSNRTRIGNGVSFVVDRAEVENISTQEAESSGKPTAKTVVIKTVREDRHHKDQWAEVLVEIRALLHEPIRYHPNIVRILDIRWDASIDTGSPFPNIIQEYATYGTLESLQKQSQPLPFSIKQKLCYDVGRGLSIVHACGFVHGDLKHENVLIFPNPYTEVPNQPFTAKLADFGGTVMDMSGDGTHRIPMHTFPFEAPEIFDRLTEEGAKKTDAYSYGMLIWRCMIDCEDILTVLGISSPGRVSDSKLRNNMKLFKLSDGLLEAALHNLASYFFSHKLPGTSFTLVTSALMFTLRGDPKQRALDRAQVRLRGMGPVDTYHYVGVKDEANQKTVENNRHKTPGRHGMDLDSVGFALGRLGNDYDAQNNLPGFRPDLPHPARSGFLFEPLILRKLLDRSQQEAMVREFELFADSPVLNDDDDLKPKPWSAAYFLFQSYLCGFGVSYSAEKACQWLRRAAEAQVETATTDYLAIAWFNRIHAALGVPNPYDAEKQFDNVFWGVVRGHRHCYEDSDVLMKASTSAGYSQTWIRKMEDADFLFRSLTSATGMPFFASRKLTRQWNLDDLAVLDSQIKEELGQAYDDCLRPAPGTDDDEADARPNDGYRFDKIFINHMGHGLLHLAASSGNLGAIKHLVQKYLCDINNKNQSHSDTALICACRCGRFSTTMWLLESGADPNGGSFCEESPLHCISGFSSEAEMDAVVAKLVAAGGDLEKHSEASRKDIRGIFADWEDSFSMTLTPLGRAVLRNSLPAVRVLLKHGASPMGKKVDRNRANISAMELAAVLTLPDILEDLIQKAEEVVFLFDECSMLDAARSDKITPYDPLSLHSRLVRCGVDYKTALKRTLRLLRDSSQMQGKAEEHPVGEHLCKEIALGNRDIVEALLGLGHPVEGSPEWRPIREAIKTNNTEIFQLLVEWGSPISFPEDGSKSLLHVFAERAPHTPRDVTIAEHLIDVFAIAVDPIVESQPSALLIAVQHGFHELADLLLSRGAGASLNTLHVIPSNPSTDSVSLLGLLVRSQTSFSVRAIRYLADIHKRPNSPHTKLAPLATAGEFSIVHALAMVPPTDWNSHGQISASIVQLVLDMFPTPTSLGSMAEHPIVGTPLTLAVLTAHAELVSALLASPGYRGDWNKVAKLEGAPAVAAGVAMAPVGLSQRLAVATLLQLEGMGSVAREKVAELRRRVEIARALIALEAALGTEAAAVSPTEQENLREVWGGVDFEARIQGLEGRLVSDFVMPEIRRDGEEVNLPVDLSVLTDEKPSNWTEGCEMTSEMSLRIFLKHFRKDNQMFGDGIVKAMSKLFNKRSYDSDGEGEGGKKGS
ncbi:serine/threonine protein kinase [Lasiosphaeria hispida]|uniref:Serine/threonine protein kinase n=1 Tax=Lasiosphaeria hispida TaxID=260671 RepID=A0AAJ0HCG4_9PEZI|nr:serine/threonine protein kinase [Lasiosphaeria hispida]